GRKTARADTITLCVQPAAYLAPDARRALGFAFVPEERLGRGAVPALPLTENGLLTAHRDGMVRAGWID
ncbi:hypothetical protein, partial [Kosakonia radicincitans]|uniref:hypothetical protein n=1 Tax=Kosakonia radicincitans TaxID=283686 RepID=UPI002367F9D7